MYKFLDMKHLLIIFSIVVFSVNVYSQTSLIKAKMEAILRKTDPSYKIYINKAGGLIEIDHVTPNGIKIELQIPYTVVNFIYRHISDEDYYSNSKMHVVMNGIEHIIDDNSKPIEHQKYHEYITMSCPNNTSCFLKSNGKPIEYTTAISQSFKNKEDAYKFLDLIDQLKKQ